MRHLIFLVMIWLVPAGVQAQETSDARELFRLGTVAYESEQWLSCAENFEGAFRAVFAPELLYNIGVCYDNASRPLGDAEAAPLVERAIAAYSRFIRELPTASEVITVRARLYELHQLMERVRRASIIATPEPEPEPVPAVAPEPTPEPLEAVLSTPDTLVVGVPDNSFDYTLTTVGGSVTLVSFLVAIGLGVTSQAEFNRLASTCGNSTFGCSDGDVGNLDTLVTASNFMYAVSGVLLAATGVAFGIEFDLSNSDNLRASIHTGARF